MSTLLNFREDEEVADRMRNLAERNQRTLTDELRDSSAVYLAFQDLAEFRASHDPSNLDGLFAEWDTRKRLDDVLARAFPDHVLAKFRAETGLDPGTGPVGPFTAKDSLLGWVLSGTE